MIKIPTARISHGSVADCGVTFATFFPPVPLRTLAAFTVGLVRDPTSAKVQLTIGTSRQNDHFCSGLVRDHLSAYRHIFKLTPRKNVFFCINSPYEINV